MIILQSTILVENPGFVKKTKILNMDRFPFEEYRILAQRQLERPQPNNHELQRPEKYLQLKLSAEILIQDPNSEWKWKSLTNFTQFEFLELYATCEYTLENHSHDDAKLTPKTKLLLVLIFLKHSAIFKKLANDFGISYSYCQNIIWNTIRLLFDVIFQKYVKWVSLVDLFTNGHRLETFPFCIGSIDATVQDICVSRERERKYYSGKHKKYCIKSQVVVNPEGLAIHIDTGYPGSVNDIEIAKHSSLIPILKAEAAITFQVFRTIPNLLADRGYTGLHHHYEGSLVMKRRPKGGNLTEAEKINNDKISKSRIIVENWFGRTKQLWQILEKRFKYNHGMYEKVFKICGALTNYHILKHPLRSDDHFHFLEISSDNEEE